MNRYVEAADLVCAQLVLALKAAKPQFGAIPITARGERRISGASLDLHLQHGYVQFSLRTDDEKWEDVRIGDWQMAGFLSSPDGQEEMARIAEILGGIYDQVPADDLLGRADRRHMLFLVAAEALLDPRVAEVLNGYHIDAPLFGEELGAAPFTFFFYDPDEMLTANYCDIVRAHRVTSRILSIEAKKYG